MKETVSREVMVEGDGEIDESEIFIEAYECGNELISISLDEIEDPCDLYNYISENCPG